MTPIASITVGRWLAVLGSDGRWVCPDPTLQTDLNRLFDPRDERFMSPSMGRFGVACAQEAAKALGGQLSIEPAPDRARPGVEY